jgi:hypothetical protein
MPSSLLFECVHLPYQTFAGAKLLQIMRITKFNVSLSSLPEAQAAYHHSF